MRLLRLQIDNYHVLRNLSLFFSDDIQKPKRGYALTFLTGVNGSGKSTVLKAVAEILVRLYQGAPIPFSFELEYILGNEDECRITVVQDEGGLRVFDSKQGSRDTFDTSLLPERVIVFTTGDESIWHDSLNKAMPFKKENAATKVEYTSEKVHVEPSLFTSQKSPTTHNNIMERQAKENSLLLEGSAPETFFGPKCRKAEDFLLYVQCKHLPLVTLCGLLSYKASGEKSYFDDILKVVQINTFQGFSLKFHLGDSIEQSDLEYLEALKSAATHVVRVGMEYLLQFDLATQERAAELLDLATGSSNHVPCSAKGLHFFEKLACLNPPNNNISLSLAEVKLLFKRAPYEADHTNESAPLLLFDQLGDGEKSFLGQMCLLLFLRDSNAETLILLDEPEAHFNDYWKRQMIYLVDRILDGWPAHAMIATQSSIILSDAESKDILLLTRSGTFTSQVFSPTISTFGASPDDIIVNVFGATHSTGAFSISTIQALLQQTELLEDRASRKEKLQNILQNTGPGYWRYLIRRELAQLDREYSQNEQQSVGELQARMLVQINRGLTVSKDDYPNTELATIERAMEKLENRYGSSVLSFNRAKTELAYHNIESVRLLYKACSDAASNTLTKNERVEAAFMLVQSFLKELGLPTPSFNTRLRNKYFVAAVAHAGDLISILPADFPVFVPLLTRHDKFDENVSKAFQKLFNSQNPDRRFGLILSPIESPLLRHSLTQPDENGVQERVVYLEEGEMRDVITRQANARARFISLLHKKVGIDTITPFITEGPTKPSLFVGRGYEIRTICNTINEQSYILVGGRRIGKTSALYHIKLLLKKRGYRVLDLDCSTVSNYYELYRTLRANWDDELEAFTFSDDSPTAFEEMIITLYKSSKRPLIFMLDEIDRLIYFDVYQRGSEQLLRIFRDLSQSNKCHFIFSGERLVYGQLRRSSSTLFNFCTPIKLELLSLDDSKKLIEEPFKQLNIPFQGGNVLIDTIVDACSGHPNLIQYFCRLIVDQLARTSFPEVTRDIVYHIIDQLSFRQRYIDVFWGQSTPLEKAITLLAGANDPLEPKSILALLRQRGFDIDQKQFSTALDYLKLYCVFQQERGGIKWSAVHFDEFVDDVIVSRQELIADLKKEFSGE